MPIVDLQRRLRECGRIRIGQQVPSRNGKTRPEKLTTFRLSSQDRQVIDTAAGLYGGTVTEAKSLPGEQWEVVTERKALDIIVPPGDMGFSQWYEQWGRNVCKVRCDGERMNVPREQPCVCDPLERACDIHTRLSVMIADLEGFGLWRLDTQGYNAAVELAGAVDLCQMAAGRGRLLPARLLLEQRSATKIKVVNGAEKIETYHFAVPVIDVGVTAGALAAGMSNVGTPLLGAGSVGELEAGPAPAPYMTPVPQQALPVASVADQIASVAAPAPKAARSNAAQPLPATGLAPRTAAEAAMNAPAAPPPPAPGGGQGPGAIPQQVPGPAAPDELLCGQCELPLSLGPAMPRKRVKGRPVHKDCPNQTSGPTPGGDDTATPFREAERALEPGKSPGEPAGGEALSTAVAPPAAPTSDEAKVAVQLRRHRAQVKKLGLDDVQRRDLIFGYSGGRTRSSTELTLDELARLTAGLRDLEQGRARLVPLADDDPLAVEFGLSWRVSVGSLAGVG